MFVRKKKNKSGSITVQIVDKSSGYYQIVATIGTSADEEEIKWLCQKAGRILYADVPGQQWLFPRNSKEELAIEDFVNSLSNAQIRTSGPEIIFGTLFDRIGLTLSQKRCSGI